MVSRSLMLAALVGALAVTAVAIGASATPGKPKVGKTLYLRPGVFCSSCHILKAAGSTGRDGPNLDSQKESYNGLVAAITKGHVPSKRWPEGMPRYGGKSALLPAADIRDIAAFVYASTHR
jgi:mono/diheme cytochrome c family protein